MINKEKKRVLEEGGTEGTYKLKIGASKPIVTQSQGRDYYGS